MYGADILRSKWVQVGVGFEDDGEEAVVGAQKGSEES